LLSNSDIAINIFDLGFGSGIDGGVDHLATISIEVLVREAVHTQ
jgi:hypothetical protein